MDQASADLYAACRVFAEAAVADLLDAGHRVPPGPGTPGWHPRGSGTFMIRGVLDIPALDLHDAFDSQHERSEYLACLEALRSHPVAAPRLDQLVGTLHGASLVEPEPTIDQLLYPLLRNGSFDASIFDATYEAVFSVLTHDTATYVVLAPLPGARFEAVPIQLDSGVEIVELSEDEIARCLNAGFLNEHTMGGFVHLEQVFGVQLKEEWPILVGPAAADHLPDVQVAWDARATQIERAVHSLRLSKAGTVYSPGTVAFSPSLFSGRATTFGLSPVPRGSARGKYALDADEVEGLVSTWRCLASEAVMSKPFLTTAVRRFAMAGERVHIEDRLLDLMIAAEALFAPATKTEVAHKVALHAAAFLARPGCDATAVFTTMKQGYAARSEIAHGATSKIPPESLRDLCETLSGYLREALRKMVDAADRGAAFADQAAWNDFIVGRLGLHEL